MFTLLFLFQIVFLVSAPFMLSLLRPRKRPICDPENRYAYIITTISAIGSIDILLTQPERSHLWLWIADNSPPAISWLLGAGLNTMNWASVKDEVLSFH